MIVEELKGGFAIHADCTSPEVFSYVHERVGKVPLIATDPPYGNVVDEIWDKIDLTDKEYAEWMFEWCEQWRKILHPNAAMYVWGGIGEPDFRPFFCFLADLEYKTAFKLANLITWKKRRAYGVQHNYIFTREECAYLFNGKDVKKPRCFNVPLLDEIRGYSGYNKKYPAKSEFYRRSNVWIDINELFRGKIHINQKPTRLFEIMIKTHTNPGEFVVDLFAGSGACAVAARKLDRQFVVIERGDKEFSILMDNLK